MCELFLNYIQKQKILKQNINNKYKNEKENECEKSTL